MVKGRWWGFMLGFIAFSPTYGLLAVNTALNQAAPVADDALIANAQTLFDQVKADMNLSQGEVIMFIPDMPNVPPQELPVMIAQANQAQSTDVKTIRTLGVCQPVPNEKYSGENGVSPALAAQAYFMLYEHREVQGTATITVLQKPTHGTLVEGSNGNYAYLPEKGYLGKDKAIVLVDIGGIKVKVVFHFQAISGGLGNYASETYCGKTGDFWKISTTLNPDGTNTLTSVEYQSPIIDAGATTADTATSASTLGASFLNSLSVDPSLVTFNLADLPGGAVGQTTGTNITLDTNAANYNWFIDTTPWDNSEYLPTSNPYEWVAKEGSAAYGKMDMLSVLLHEYGHALGIEHSADNHDYMATTLTPGVRRMPSAEEMALMQSLVAQIKGEMTATLSPSPSPASGRGWPAGSGEGPDDAPMPLPIPLGAGFGMAFIGRMRRGSYGGTTIDTVGAQFIAPNTQYAVAANATFANLATPAGWNSQGSVDINPSTGSGRTASVTLNEISTSQTRLSQVFMLNEQDRYLSFTLSGTALDDLNGALYAYAMDVDGDPVRARRAVPLL